MPTPQHQPGVEAGDHVVGDDPGTFGKPFEPADRGRLENVEDAEDHESGYQPGQVHRQKAATEDQRDGDDFVEHHLSGILAIEQSTGSGADRDRGSCGDQGDQQSQAREADLETGQKRLGNRGDSPRPGQAHDASDRARCPARTTAAQAGGQQQNQVLTGGTTGVTVTVTQLFSPFGDEYTRVLSANLLLHPYGNDFPMPDEVKLDKSEFVKEDSRQLRGTIADELAEDELDHFSKDNAGLLKHHGLYQQDNRDARKQKNADGTPRGKTFMFMVRTRIPGGRVPADALLAELDLCERYGNQTLRITSRQGLQLHGIIKDNLQETIREINRTQLTTFGACGDIERNVMCCPAPLRHDTVHDQLQQTAEVIAEELKPRTTAYSEIWLEDDQGNRRDVTEFTPVDEPIYGSRYLPRKFKSGVALPEDNCVDILTYDLGLLGIVESGSLVGYNVFVGGGQGVTPSAAKTFPAVAQKMAFIGVDEAAEVARALVCVFRDHGNRSDRKTARLKYLLAGWGMERLKGMVEEYLGRPMAEPHPAEVTGVEDHLGWSAQGDGRDFLGIYVENGRIQDTETVRTKSALRRIVEAHRMPTRMTAQQNILLCDIEPSQRDEIDRILADHGVVPAEEHSQIRRLSMACPALPTCGLSITESERVMPEILDRLEHELTRHELADEQITIHTTGCPNGCARPYSPDIGLVGKTAGKYTVFLGGNSLGTRLAFNFSRSRPLR